MNSTRHNTAYEKHSYNLDIHVVLPE